MMMMDDAYDNDNAVVLVIRARCKFERHIGKPLFENGPPFWA